MTTKVNGGVRQGFWTEGAVAFYTVTVAAAILTDIVATDGVTVVPNSALEKVIEAVSAKAVVIGIEYAEGGTEIKLALTRSAWTAADLQTALVALGTSVTVNRYDGSDAIITTTVTYAATTVATSADFLGTAV